MNDSSVIKTSALQYHYTRNVQTLFDVNIEVNKGDIYGFLGPNGSGKTTTLSLLLGLLQPTGGHIEVFGQELQKNRIDILKKIGSLIENPSLYGHLTARENLRIYAPVYGASENRINEVLDIAGISDTGKKTVKKFSLGMKQRLSIALALLPSPELLVLDEPSNGLDPAGIIELRELIKKLNKEYGMTIIISSHILAEVEKMVTHLGIISKGKILFQGRLQDLNTFHGQGSVIHIRTSDNKRAAGLLKNHSPRHLHDYFTVAYSNPQEIADINKMLVQNGIDVFLLQPNENDLEQLFIDLTTA
jgi:ABC-2 type transport system ATP-binding protein